MRIEVPELLTVQQVAAQLNVSLETIRQLIRDQEIAAYRIRHSIRVIAPSVGRYLARTTTGKGRAA